MSAQSVIKNFMSSLNRTSKSGTAALDEAVQSVSKFSSWAEVINTMAKDCAAYDGNGEDFLKDMCDIVLYNEDTGAITGSDAGGGSTKTPESVVPESGSWRYPSSSSFTISGLTVNIHDFDELSDSEEWIVGALYTWWIKESLSLIDNSYGLNFNTSGATVKTLDVYFYDRADGKMAASSYSTGQTSTQLQLRINMHYYNDIDTNDPNGVGSSEALVTLDRTIAHELTHAVMSANIDYYNNLPFSFKEGSAELVHGIDDKRLEKIDSLSKSSSSLKNAMSGTNTDTYAAGYIALRYLAKQAAEGRDPADEIDPLPGNTTAEVVDDTTIAETVTTTDNTAVADAVSATAAADTSAVVESAVLVEGTVMKIIGTTVDDVWLSGMNPFTGAPNAYGNAETIILDAADMTQSRYLGGNDQDNYIINSNVGSTTWGGVLGNDIMVGGAGKDTFWFLRGCGRDTVVNYQTGAAGDVLNLIGGGITNIYRAGANFEITLDDGSALTVATDDASANNRITYTYDGSEFLSAKIGKTNEVNDFIFEGDSIYYVGGNNLNALHVTTAGVYVDLDEEVYSNIQVLDARSSGGGNELIGDAFANHIISGGNDSTVWGGADEADDVLFGGTGKDTFIYGVDEGNDIINGAEDSDVIDFYNAFLRDLTVTQADDSGVVLALGLKNLTITGQNNPILHFADGSNYRYDRASRSWTNA